MPHPNNDNWISLLAGRSVKATPAKSIEEIKSQRSRIHDPEANQNLPEMSEIHEQVIIWERGDFILTAEVYVPKGKGPFPVLLYLHGGGWCVGSPERVRAPATRLAEGGFTVINLDYSLAPERPYPNALEDCIYTARWATLNAQRFNGDGTRLFIAGDSAGANLSAATIVALTAPPYDLVLKLDDGDLGGVKVQFAGALLFYGVFDFPLATKEPGSNAGNVEVNWNRAYLGPHFLNQHYNPLVSPNYAPNLDKFPPTYLSCGDEDSLLGHSLSMTKALTQRNVTTTLSVIEGLDHAFSYVERKLPEVTPEFERILNWLAKHR